MIISEEWKERLTIHGGFLIYSLSPHNKCNKGVKTRKIRNTLKPQSSGTSMLYKLQYGWMIASVVAARTDRSRQNYEQHFIRRRQQRPLVNWCDSSRPVNSIDSN